MGEDRNSQPRVSVLFGPRDLRNRLVTCFLVVPMYHQLTQLPKLMEIHWFRDLPHLTVSLGSFGMWRHFGNLFRAELGFRPLFQPGSLCFDSAECRFLLPLTVIAPKHLRTSTQINWMGMGGNSEPPVPPRNFCPHIVGSIQIIKKSRYIYIIFYI